jgi:hypothetical protein
MSKYDIHKWKDGELNERLMEKWGYKKKVIKEAAKPDYIDIDKDGDKDEPMKQAAKDAKSKKGDAPADEEEEEEVNEEISSTGGVPMVPAGNIEGMANAAIAAIVQLAAEAGVKLNVTSDDDSMPDDMDDMDMDDVDMEDEGGEAEEQDLMDPEDL